MTVFNNYHVGVTCMTGFRLSNWLRTSFNLFCVSLYKRSSHFVSVSHSHLYSPICCCDSDSTIDYNLKIVYSNLSHLVAAVHGFVAERISNIHGVCYRLQGLGEPTK